MRGLLGRSWGEDEGEWEHYRYRRRWVWGKPEFRKWVVKKISASINPSSKGRFGLELGIWGAGYGIIDETSNFSDIAFRC